MDVKRGFVSQPDRQKGKEKMNRKQICAIGLILTMLLLIFSAGAADAVWTCAVCGQEGCTGNFCNICGAARPADTSAVWTCPVCGQEGCTGNFCNICGAARPAGSSAPQVNLNLEQIPGQTDRVKVRLGEVTAFDYIKNSKDPLRWVPSNAADGNETTCWQYNPPKKGKEAWLELSTLAPEAVDEIWFKNGFWAYNDKGNDQYGINARLKKVRVSLLYAGETSYRDAKEFTLKDESRNGWQAFSLDHHEGVAAVRVTVLSHYAGSHYKNDICLSEVMLVQHAPATLAAAPQQEQKAVVYESRPEVSGANLLMKLATRSGPGTQYDEPGTFFGNTWKNETVKVLGKEYDGSVWWVLVDFSNGGKASYRVWTGLKRVDVDLNKVKEYYATGQGTVSATSETYRGPGGKYAKAKVNISSWKDVVAYGRENGFVEIEYETDSGKWYRLWVPEKYTSIDWN